MHELCRRILGPPHDDAGRPACGRLDDDHAEALPLGRGCDACGPAEGVRDLGLGAVAGEVDAAIETARERLEAGPRRPVAEDLEPQAWPSLARPREAAQERVDALLVH